MKAMILAAGFGKRLGELGESTPKCLVEAGGKTMLEHVVSHCKKAGINSFVINLHHLADKVVEFVESKNHFDVEITFSRERDILETGGGIKFAESLLSNSEPFLVHNADVYTELDLSSLISTHNSSECIATLATNRRDSSRRMMFCQGELVGWKNMESGVTRESRVFTGEEDALCFAGIYVLSPKIFSFMPEAGGNFSIIDTFLSASAKGEKIGNLDISDSYWMDVGSVEKLNSLNEHLIGS